MLELLLRLELLDSLLTQKLAFAFVVMREGLLPVFLQHLANPVFSHVEIPGRLRLVLWLNLEDALLRSILGKLSLVVFCQDRQSLLSITSLDHV